MEHFYLFDSYFVVCAGLNKDQKRREVRMERLNLVNESCVEYVIPMSFHGIKERFRRDCERFQQIIVKIINI
jgi:hypothetical protein